MNLILCHRSVAGTNKRRKQKLYNIFILSAKFSKTILQSTLEFHKTTLLSTLKIINYTIAKRT